MVSEKARKLQIMSFDQNEPKRDFLNAKNFSKSDFLKKFKIKI